MPMRQRLDQLLVHAVGGAQPKLALGVVENVDRTRLGAGELRRLGDDGREHGFEIEGRVHRLRYLTERAQLADRAAELVGALAQLVEQPRILDGDDGLSGETGDELDLLVGERTDFRAIDRDCTDRLVLLEQRHAQIRANRQAARRRRRRTGPDPGRLAPPHSRRCGPSVSCRIARNRPDRGPGCGGVTLDRRRKVPSRRREGRRPRAATKWRILRAQICTALSNMAWNTGCSSPGELEMTRSTSDVAVCCSSDSVRSSVRCAQLVEQPRVLDGDDGLSGEVLHQRDLLVGERPDLLAIDRDRADQLVLLEHRHRYERSACRRARRPQRLPDRRRV